jgi:hypothetical protein
VSTIGTRIAMPTTGGCIPVACIGGCIAMPGIGGCINSRAPKQKKRTKCQWQDPPVFKNTLLFENWNFH